MELTSRFGKFSDQDITSEKKGPTCMYCSA